MASRSASAVKVIVGHCRTRPCCTSSASGCAPRRHGPTSQTARFARSAQHAQRRRHGGRQGRGRNRLRLLVNGYGLSIWVAFQTRSPTADQRLLWPNTSAPTTSFRAEEGGTRHERCAAPARIELALRAFLEDGGLRRLHRHLGEPYGLKAAAGIASQLPDADGYGFGPRAMEDRRLRACRQVMAAGLPWARPSWKTTRNTSETAASASRGNMLEICPSIAATSPAAKSIARPRRQGRPGAPGFTAPPAGRQCRHHGTWATASA